MPQTMKHTDISNVPELIRLAEAVRTTKQPRLLKRASETLAMLMPVAAPPRRLSAKPSAKTDFAAFRSAAGGWKAVDTEALKTAIYADRRQSNRAPVKL